MEEINNVKETKTVESVSKTFLAKIENLHDVLGFLEEQLETHNASMKLVNIMSISLEEMYANVCMYAYAQKGEPGDCTIRISFMNGSVDVTIIDDGFAFNPLAKIDPNIHADIEDRGIGGLGIYMVKKYMDECFYERTNEQNIFTMRKALS